MVERGSRPGIPGRPRIRPVVGVVSTLGPALLLTSCESEQSTLRPGSDAADEITTLWWIMLAGAVVVFGVVLVLVLAAILRRRRSGEGGDGRARTWIALGGIVAPIVVLSALFVLVLRTLPATSAGAAADAELTVEVVGKQWFWEARYPGTDAVTANEIHIPAGVPVRLVGTTADVVHSFWVPRLNRKIDLIPGKRNEILLEADEPGVYRGQCAEFCGLQHAHMAFLVIAEPEGDFRRWLDHEAQPRSEPATAQAREGEEVFASAACAGCHTIRGTDADGDLGPDLTHVAARGTLAAVTIPNRLPYLSEWIADPQHVKPGNKMPALGLSGSELGALVAYVRGLE